MLFEFNLVGFINHGKFLKKAKTQIITKQIKYYFI